MATTEEIERQPGPPFLPPLSVSKTRYDISRSGTRRNIDDLAWNNLAKATFRRSYLAMSFVQHVAGFDPR